MKDIDKRKLEEALKKRCGYGVNLLEVKDGRIIFNYRGNILHESQRYQIKFELKNDEPVLAENSQKIIQEVLPPKDLLIYETSDPDPSIVGTKKAILSEEEKRIIYGVKFVPRKNQEK